MIVVGCALFTVLMPALGSTLPAPRDELFSFCELPCVGGLIPGKTAFQNVVSILNQHFTGLVLETSTPRSTIPPIVFSEQLEERFVRGTIIGNDLVRTITFESNFRLIDLLYLMGTPACISHELIIEGISTFVMIQWRFEDDGVTATAFLSIDSANRWGPYAAVPSFRLSVSETPCRSGRLETRAWRSFPMFWRFKFED